MQMLIHNCVYMICICTESSIYLSSHVSSKVSVNTCTDHLYRSTTSLYGLAFLVSEIKCAISFQRCGKFYKLTTSLNGPDEFTPVSGRFR